MTTATKETGGSKSRAAMPKARKQLSREERRTPKGRFAAHLQALLDERGLTTAGFAGAIGVGEPTVRKWLRADSVPETLDLERIGKALNTAKHPFPDYRHILPPPK